MAAVAPRDRDERHRPTDSTTIHDMTTTATTTILATTHPPYMERTERVRPGVDGVYRYCDASPSIWCPGGMGWSVTDRRPPRERERAGARSLGSRLAGVRARLRRGHRVPSCNLWERPCVMRGDEIDVRVSDVSIRTTPREWAGWRTAARRRPWLLLMTVPTMAPISARRARRMLTWMRSTRTRARRMTRWTPTHRL